MIAFDSIFILFPESAVLFSEDIHGVQFTFRKWRENPLIARSFWHLYGPADPEMSKLSGDWTDVKTILSEGGHLELWNDESDKDRDCKDLKEALDFLRVTSPQTSSVPVTWLGNGSRTAKRSSSLSQSNPGFLIDFWMPAIFSAPCRLFYTPPAQSLR